MRDVAESIQLCAQTQPLVKSCNTLWLDGIGPGSFAAVLGRVALNTEGVGVLTTDHPRTRDAIRQLCESGVRVVTLASDVLLTPRSSYVGIDNRIAGRTAGQIVGMLVGVHEGAVAVFCGSRAFHGHQEREAGFVTFMGEHHPGLEILPTIETGEDSAKLRTALARLLRSVLDLLAVYCVGAGRKGIVEALENRQERPRIVMHDLTKSSRSWLVEDRIDAVIDQTVFHLLGAIASGPSMLPLTHIEPSIFLRENIPKGRLTRRRALKDRPLSSLERQAGLAARGHSTSLRRVQIPCRWQT